MNGLTYTHNGDHLIPDIAIRGVPPLGRYGMMRKDYLREHRPILYSNLALKEELFPHCLEIGEEAEARLEPMMAELISRNPPPDKASDPMGWAAHMNSLKAQAEEVILSELIYS